MRFSLLSLSLAIANAQMSEPWGQCGGDEYYAELGSDVSSWDKEGLHNLVKTSHRNVLPFTNTEKPGVDDVWAAIMDLDIGSAPESVRLLYNDEELPAIPFGQRSWIKEHLFPLLRGPGLLGPDVSDIHNIRPSAPLTDIVRNIKYFGECGVLVRPETCIQPAEGAAGDTCSCNRLFTPPADRKGDIARALMYMDLRYDGSELATLDLRLTDCPFQPERDMAYLSQMLQWHAEDPPDEAEKLRNDKACMIWQGNRNPFVDHPDLATQIFGQPLPLPAVGERLIYEACEAIPTLPPTFSPNQCEFYEPGDFQFWVMNSDDPDAFGIYNFNDMPEGFELFVTDNPWNGEEFVEQEGTLKFTVPAGGIDAGTAFGFGDSGFNYTENWSVEQGTLSLSTDGEPVFIFCLEASGDQRPLLAFNYGGVFVDNGLDSYGPEESGLPDTLGDYGVVQLPHYKNYLYVGESNLPDEELKMEVVKSENWEGSNDRYALDPGASSAQSTGIMMAVAVTTAILGMFM